MSDIRMSDIRMSDIRMSDIRMSDIILSVTIQLMAILNYKIELNVFKTDCFLRVPINFFLVC
jgi:hypothetical protein